MRKSVNQEKPKDLKVICIIPARSGSKGFPDKNVKPLCGQPLIWHTVNCAIKTNQIDKVVVSTDSAQYRDIIDGRFGPGYVPFLRPDELATDTTPVSKSALYTIDRIEAETQQKYDILVLLEHTSPIRTPGQLNEAISMLKDAARYRALVSVFCDEQCNPLYAFDMATDKHLRPFDGARQYPDGNMRRQAMRKAWYMDGSFYISYIDTYRDKLSFVHEGTLGYPVPGWQSDEIDYEYDLVKIEAIMKWRKA
jgi:N-acylneuraminate cytidylyltransferase/CMP-N,N'-diacetyllegionaminic acid synthase